MSDYVRPRLTWGNDFTINIELQQFYNGDYVDFNINTVKSLEVYLICSTHNQKIPLEWEIEPGFDNIISCFVDYRVTHPNTSYGVGVEGIDEYDKHFRWYMLPKEGILVISNTSGQNIPQNVEVVDLIGRVGFGVQTDADLTNYYTKIEVNTLLDEKADESELADKQDTLVSGTNIKTINSQSLLGSGNMVIEGTEQLQSDWTQTDTSAKDYIKHKPTIPAAQVNSDWNATSGVAKILNKPDLNNYATKTDLNNYYDKGQTDGLLNSKVDVSTLNSDYYNKNTVNNLLDAKVDTSDLAQVATSGSYNDLTNKPDLSVYATHTELNTKQDTLVSGTNIKTINNESILGSGNINIDAENNDEVTANALYDINQRLSEAEFGVKSIPQDIDAKIVPVNERINEVSNDVIDLTNDIDNTNLANSLILNELHNEIYETIIVEYGTTVTQETLNKIYANPNNTLLAVNNNSVINYYTLEAYRPGSYLNFSWNRYGIFPDHQLQAYWCYDMGTDTWSYHANELQDRLISGTNIKTINGNDILGSGDITVGGGVQSDWNETNTTSLAYIQNKPTISEPGFVKLVNGNKTGLVSSLTTIYNTNIGDGAVIEGNGYGSNQSTASGDYSHSEGMGGKATGYAAHAEGYYSTASANQSHAEGYSTTASGQASHAEGRYTNAQKACSHAEGEYTQTINMYEHASGRYNISSGGWTAIYPDSRNTLFSVGNGTSDSARHNAFEIRQNGDIYLNDGSHPVSSTTNGLKMETVSSTPSGTVPVTLAFDSTTNTLYIVQ